jgi:putative transposase
MLRTAKAASAQGMKVGESCRSLGVSAQGGCRWCREDGGLKTSQAEQMKGPARENTRLKKALADLALDTLMLREVLEGNYHAPCGVGAAGSISKTPSHPTCSEICSSVFHRECASIRRFNNPAVFFLETSRIRRVAREVPAAVVRAG